MKSLVIATVTALGLVATVASAQQPSGQHQHDQAKPPAQSAPAPERGGLHGGGGMPGGGMMGGMHGGGMMGGMHGGGMHAGGMMGGMCGMMGAMGMGPMMGGASDPKTLGRMLQMRGEIMKAVGDVLIKHGQALGTDAGR